MKRRVLVTRAGEQAAEFAATLEAFGFEAIIFPLIEFKEPKDKKKLEKAFRDLASYDWILLTSANAVKFFINRLKERDKNLSSIEGIPVCAVGPKTAEAAEKAGIFVDLVPPNFQAEGVLQSFDSFGIEGKKILFPRAEEGRDVLLRGLENLGAEVTLVPVYRTVKPKGKKRELKELVEKGIDVVTFTSGSTVRNFLEILGRENLALLDRIKIACISEVTAAVARDHDLKTDIIPSQNTTRALAEAIGKYFI